MAPAGPHRFRWSIRRTAHIRHASVYRLAWATGVPYAEWCGGCWRRELLDCIAIGNTVRHGGRVGRGRCRLHPYRSITGQCDAGRISNLLVSSGRGSRDRGWSSGFRRGFCFRLYAEGSQSTQSGIAITNPSSTPASVNLELVNSGGATVAGGSLAVGANSQVGAFLNQIPGFEGLRLPFQGLLRVTSSVPVAVAGLRGRYNERGDFIITTTAPISEQFVPPASDVYFGHFADGGDSQRSLLFSVAPDSRPPEASVLSHRPASHWS